MNNPSQALKHNSDFLSIVENHRNSQESSKNPIVEGEAIAPTSAPTSTPTPPTLWVSSIVAAAPLIGGLFKVIECRPEALDEIHPGQHHILADKRMPEAHIKALAWRIQKAGGTCKVLAVSNYLENLVTDLTTAKEITVQIVTQARPYEEWAARNDEVALTLSEAAEVAQVAIALLPESKKLIEIGILRERCSQNSYDWNQLVRKLEEEFKEELERRGIASGKDLIDSKLTKRDAVEQARNIILLGLDELEESLQLEELREKSGLSSTFWERQVLAPLRRSLQAKRLTLEIQAYLRETDLATQFTERNRITSRYRITNREFEQQCHAIRFAEQQSAEKPRLILPKELFTLESENLDWLVPGFLPRHTSAMVSGLPGTGKSLLTIDLAYAIATGGLFLGEQVKQGKVLIINSDQPLNVTSIYLSDRGFDEDTPNWTVVGQTGNIAAWTIKDLDLLETWLEQIKPDLVIIDSIRTTICYPLGLEEKSELVGHWLKEVERLVIRYGGTLLWVHHDNKDKNLSGVSRSSGSTAIPGNVSVHWRLEKTSKDDSDPNRIFSMPKTRLFEPTTLNIRFDNTTGQWLNLGRVGESPDVAKQNQSLQQRVLDLLMQRPSVGFTFTEIQAYVGGGDSLYTVLSRMTQRGIIGKRKGKDSKSKVYFWELPNTPQIDQTVLPNTLQTEQTNLPNTPQTEQTVLPNTLKDLVQHPPSQLSDPDVRHNAESLTIQTTHISNTYLTHTQEISNIYPTHTQQISNTDKSVGYLLDDETLSIAGDAAKEQNLTGSPNRGGGLNGDVEQTSAISGDEIIDCAQLIAEALTKMDWELIETLTADWNKEKKARVWALLSEEDKAALQRLKPQPERSLAVGDRVVVGDESETRAGFTGTIHKILGDKAVVNFESQTGWSRKLLEKPIRLAALERVG